MARRGRPIKNPRPGAKASLGLKVTPHMKARIEAAAREAGRTQSQETEFRLERSFERQDLMSDALTLAYGPQLAGLLMIIGRVMHVTGSHTGFMADHETALTKAWLENPFAYSEAEKALALIINCFRPAGPVIVPGGAGALHSHLNIQSFGPGFATGILSAIAGHPSTESDAAFAAIVRPLLGRMAEVDEPIKGNAK